MSPTGTRKVCRRTDARGITTTYSYDAESQLTSKTYSDSTPAAYYYYDESSVTVNGQGYTLANGKGRLTHTSADNGGWRIHRVCCDVCDQGIRSI